MAYNLSSPNGILEPCSLNDLDAWFRREVKQVSNLSERRVLLEVIDNIEAFVRLPSEAILLWPGCDRVPPPGKRQKYFSYPSHLKQLAINCKTPLDTRQNGPAILAFRAAGGERPSRFGSSNAWSIHHLYSGKFPYLAKVSSMHAAKHGQHFTQSAGLVAVHPVADALVDEFPFFTWLLRAMAYNRFGYDPDRVFSNDTDDYGFARGRDFKIITELS